MEYIQKSDTKEKNKISGDAGSTLVTVLVGVSFLVILAVIIMSVSFANLRMKQVEYNAKRNFYEDEQGLDDIYNGIGRDVSSCLARAYNDTLAEISTADGKSKYGSQSKAYEYFVTLFTLRLEAMYGGDGAHLDGTENLLKSYITREEEVVPGEQTSSAELIGYGETKEAKDDSGFLSKYVFEDVQVKYTERRGGSETGYESVITTDIVVEVPYISFFQDFSRVLDYALIGNKGIYFKNADKLIEGSVYAGTDDKDKNADYMGYHYSDGTVYDGMNFYGSTVEFKDSNYIISKGDFNICESNVNVYASSGKQAAVNIWAENIRTVENNRSGVPVSDKDKPSVESKLTADANLYVADDLELNARSSRVTLKGNYYGYNYNNVHDGVNDAYETTEKKNLQDIYETDGSVKAAHATSSSIVINANDSVLDLNDLNTLVVAGLAYVDIKNPETSYQTMASSGEMTKEYQTGESLALRYNQALYLAPMDILYVANPALNGSVDINEVCPPKSDEKSKLSNWFGKDYLVEAEPVKPVVYNVAGKSYTYYYLNFKSEAEKAAYVQEVMEATEAQETDEKFLKQKWELKQSVLKKASNAGIESNIVVDGSGCKIYAKGILTSTSDGKSTTDNNLTKPAVYKESIKMAQHFVYLYKRLDPAEKYGIVSDSLSVTELEADISSKGLEEEKLPLDYFVELDNIVNDAGHTVKGYQVIIKTSGGSVPVISSDVKGIIISKGDIIISGSVEGIVLSGGKITVTSGGSIKANRGIVQTILENEQRELSSIKESKITISFLQDYASYYFKQSLVNDTLVNELNHKYVDNTERITSTEYTDYMYFENWKKGA